MAEQVSGDCDDEDGCGGSGSGEVKRTLKITDYSHHHTKFYIFEKARTQSQTFIIPILNYLLFHNPLTQS
ncbi:hypothetical protein MJG53_009974 [Ovis ammon polii x Ovis aries]|nr:hypothetical protein MJG53_009974 [Ovis ammon polii x Ovis aries]